MAKYKTREITPQSTRLNEEGMYAGTLQSINVFPVELDGKYTAHKASLLFKINDDTNSHVVYEHWLDAYDEVDGEWKRNLDAEVQRILPKFITKLTVLAGLPRQSALNIIVDDNDLPIVKREDDMPDDHYVLSDFVGEQAVLKCEDVEGYVVVKEILSKEAVDLIDDVVGVIE